MKNIFLTLVVSCLSLSVSPVFAQGEIEVSIGIRPPALLVYEQPPCPEDGYMWQPGYWAYSPEDADYYWVPGVWVAPPQPNLYWTPCYWGFAGGNYGFHRGYWGAQVGFYGGINYGFGFGGVGYHGGEWHQGGFRYNTAIVNVNRTVVHNTYVNNSVVNNTTVNNRVSFNGEGGVSARPTPNEQAASREPHVQATAEQRSHEQGARANKSQFVKTNNGRPATTSMNRVKTETAHPENNVRPSTSEVHQQTESEKPKESKTPNANPAQHKNPEVNVQQKQNPVHKQQPQPHQKQNQVPHEDKAVKHPH